MTNSREDGQTSPSGQQSGIGDAPDTEPSASGANDDQTAEVQEGQIHHEQQQEVADIQPADPVELLAEAQEQLAKAADEALRARAEMDNVRKRAARDADNARRFALEKFMGDMLDVTESLERGLLAAEGDQATVEQLLEGTRLTSRMLEKVLTKHGLEEVIPENEPFDPERHEALSLIPTDEFDPDTVVQVVQKGYLLNGRLLRPARVLVAKATDT